MCGSITVEADVVGVAADAGIAYIAFALDGTTTAQVATPPYDWTWDTTRTTNGIHIVRATLTDGLGAQTPSAVAVTVANTGGACDNWPWLKITATPPPFINAGGATIAAAAADDIGVSKVEFFEGGTSLGSDFMAPYSANWPSSSLPEGPRSWVISATATDTASHATTKEKRGITIVDLTPPVLAIDAGSNPDGGAAPLAHVVSFSVNDNLGTPTTTTMCSYPGNPYIPSGTTTQANCSSGTCSCGSAGYPQACYVPPRMTITATDQAGNSATRRETVCIGSPFTGGVGFATPTNGATVSGSSVPVRVSLSPLYSCSLAVVFAVDGQTVANSPCLAGNCGLLWDTTPVAKTSHQLSMTVHSCGGVPVSATPITVTVQ